MAFLTLGFGVAVEEDEAASGAGDFAAAAAVVVDDDGSASAGADAGVSVVVVVMGAGVVEELAPSAGLLVVALAGVVSSDAMLGWWLWYIDEVFDRSVAWLT